MISIVSGPPYGLIPKNFPLEWVVSTSDVGSGNITKKIGYELICVASGLPISKMRSITPKGVGVNETINFQNIAWPEVSTTFPDMDITANQADDTFKKQVALRVYEISYDSDTCENAITFEGASDPVTIMNSVVQRYQEYFNGFWNNRPLSLRPKCWKVCKNSYQWMTFCGPTMIRLRAFDHNGNPYITILKDTGAGVNHITIGPANAFVGLVNNISRVEVYFDSGGVLTLIGTYHIDRCCCDDKLHEIYFISPLGGIDTMVFDCDAEYTVSRNYTEVCTYVNTGYDRQRFRQQSGSYGLDVKNKRQLKLRKKIGFNRDQMRWAESFLHSGEHWIRMDHIEGPATVPQRQRFLVQSGNIKVWETEGLAYLEITGTIG